MSRDTPAPDDAAEMLKLRELSEKATPGEAFTAGLPWFADASGVLVGSPDPHAGYMIADCENWIGERDEAREDGKEWLADPDDDAAFIAACWNYVRAKLAAPSGPPAAAAADAIRRARVEALEEAAEIVQSKYLNVMAGPGPIPSLRDHLAREIRRLIPASAIPPETGLANSKGGDPDPVLKQVTFKQQSASGSNSKGHMTSAGSADDTAAAGPAADGGHAYSPLTLGRPLYSDALAVMEAMGKALEPFVSNFEHMSGSTENGNWFSMRHHLDELREARDALAAFRAWRAGGGR